jgi:hypothetical protein
MRLQLDVGRASSCKLHPRLVKGAVCRRNECRTYWSYPSRFQLPSVLMASRPTQPNQDLATSQESSLWTIRPARLAIPRLHDESNLFQEEMCSPCRFALLLESLESRRDQNVEGSGEGNSRGRISEFPDIPDRDSVFLVRLRP